MQRSSVDDHEKLLCESAEITRGQIQRLKNKITALQSLFSEANVKYSQLLRAPEGGADYVTLLRNSKKELEDIRASLFRRRQEKEDAEQVLRDIGNELANAHTARIALRVSQDREKIVQTEKMDDKFEGFAHRLLEIITVENQPLYSDAQTVITFLKTLPATDQERMTLINGYIQATLLIIENDDASYKALKAVIKDSEIDENAALNQYATLWMDHISELPSITKQSDHEVVIEKGQKLLTALEADKVLDPETKSEIGNAAKNLMSHPEDVQAQNALTEVVQATQKRKIYVPAVIVGGIISLLAAATIAVSAALGALTLGLGAPLVIAGFVIGGSMLASGVTMMLPPVHNCGLFTRRRSGRHDEENVAVRDQGCK